MKLLISGYYGFGNAGDEWVLEALLKNLSAPQTVTVLSADPAGTRRQHGVEAVNRWSLPALARALRQCEVLISGGGGLLQDASGPWTPAYYLGLMAWARLYGRRVLLAGQGFGPIKRGWNHWLCGRLLPLAESVMTRDRPGQAWCLEHGVARERVVLGADWVWSLPAARPSPGTDLAVCLRREGLQQCPPGWLPEFLHRAQAQNRRVRFLVLGNRGDRECLSDLGGVPERDVEDLTGSSWSQAVERLRGVAWVLSMRYHGLILGSAAGAAVAGWGFDPKLANLLGELQAPDLRTLGSPALKSLLAGHQAARAKQEPGAAQLRERAVHMAQRLREFLI